MSQIPPRRSPGNTASDSIPTPSWRVQRKCACGAHGDGECNDCQKRRLQRKGGSQPAPAIPAAVSQVLGGAGHAMDTSTRGFMEQRFGHDFSQVRIHTDDSAAHSARAVDAVAYTVGSDVVFDRGQYRPDTSSGRQLLAHELTHVVQQRNGAGGGGGIESPGSAAEREADAVAAQIDSSQPLRVQTNMPERRVARQAAVPLPVEPAVEPEVFPEGEAANDNAVPSETFPTGEIGPRYAPNPNNHSLEADLARAQIRDHAERVKLQQERPVATLDRGGAAPDFVTEKGKRTYTWIGGIGGGGSVVVRNRFFHVLDAIEDAVSKVNSPEELQDVAQQYLPLTSIYEEGISQSRREHPFRQPQLPIAKPFWEAPVYPQNFDPQAAARLATFGAAVDKRTKAVPALANSRLKPKTRRKGGCRIEPIETMGGDPLSGLYCHLATGSPLSYKITIESSTGGLTQRWAEIDSLRGDTWYECKCGYEALLTGAARGERVAAAVLDKLDHQVLNHVDIANTCGLQYRYIVSNQTVANLLRSRWFGNVTIDVVPFEHCD
ncbi:MAG TPA: DUF4157 domain-containing protein [Dyella sp.]|uniref:DUF4157 domain-containing protein n=1 Tax=Dyella sp. TaxID=1869338 RepID=UPI002F93CEE6